MEELRRRILEALTAVAGAVPKSHRGPHLNPRSASRQVAQTYAKQSAAVSAGSAILPGIGVTIGLVADLVAVLKLQQKMIADIAALYGLPESLTREVMIGLLFKDTSPNAARSLLASHAGWSKPGSGTLAVNSDTFLKRALRKIAWGLARRMLGKTFSRIIPVIGAGAAGIGSYRGTLLVAETAMAYFESRGHDGEPASAKAALGAG